MRHKSFLRSLVLSAPSRARTNSTTIVAAILTAFLATLAPAWAGGDPACQVVGEVAGFGPGFKLAVAVSVDTAVVGDYGRTVGSASTAGAVFVARRDSTGWAFQQFLAAPDGATDDWLGYSVAVDGDTIIAGAPTSEFTQTHGGAAYVFGRDNCGLWSFRQKLLPSDLTSGHVFGYAVALKGDTALVTAIGHPSNFGSVYVFTRTNGVWSQTQKLVPASAKGVFGVSVDIGCDWAVVGSPDIFSTDSGAVFIMHRATSGNWTLNSAFITAFDPSFRDEFGRDVAISGDTIIVAAPSVGTIRKGAIYTLRNNGGVWLLSPQKVTAPSTPTSDQFGRDIDISGETMIANSLIGINDATTGGSAYVFDLINGSWMQTDHFSGDGGFPNRFANGLAMDAGAAAFSGYLDQFDPNSGRLYTYNCVVFGESDGCGTDTDGDGLWDSWEVAGVPFIGGDGQPYTYLIDLDGDGVSDADPMHKDVFIEVDAMAGYAPPPATIQRVQDAFASAPVGNPDCLPGINLHVLVDDTNIPPAVWNLVDTNGDGAADWPAEFEIVKYLAASGTTLLGYFGTFNERNEIYAAQVRDVRKNVFRYCMFAQVENPGSRIPGRAELPGNDFYCTFGLWGGIPTAQQQAAIFMHELGHTFGLGHGGGQTDGAHNYKPNYYSVMNYAWQNRRPWMATGWWPMDPGRPGYSTRALPTLDEAALGDCQSLVAANDPLLAGLKIPHNTLSNPLFVPFVVQSRIDTPIDWNFNFTCDPGMMTVDINHLRFDPIIPSSIQTAPAPLEGHDDWSNLQYNFRQTAAFQDGIHARGGTDPDPELGPDDLAFLETLFPPYCGSDLNGDRRVDVIDLFKLLSAWGNCAAGCVADIQPFPADGNVDVNDLFALLHDWGPCPDP